MKKKLSVLLGVALSSAPFLVLAQGGTSGCEGITGDGTIKGMICTIGDILNVVVPVIIVLGVVYFVWGVVTYVIANEEEAKKKGRNMMIYGIIGLVVIMAMWGLVALVTNTFNLQGTVTIPDLNPYNF